MEFIIIIPLLLIILLIMNNIRIVPQAQAYVVERLGKYKSTWDSGLHLKVPFIEKVVRKVSLKEQVLDFPPQGVITKDNVTMQIDSVVFCKVFDPMLYCYGVDSPITGLQNLAATTLRNIIGEMELDQTLTGRDEINKRMTAILDEATDSWGLKVSRVEIKNIVPPESILATMELQMKAERERRQTVLEAKAHQEAVVSRAEGDKQAKILAAEAERDAQIALAEGRAKSIALVYEAEAKGLEQLNKANVSETVLRLKGIEAMKDIADGKATKVFIPNDLSSAISSLSVAGEALATGMSGINPTEESASHHSVNFEPDFCCDDISNAGTRDAAYCTDSIEKDVEA